MVNWADANRYCRAMGKRLPKEVEWEKAFRGVNANVYPWQAKRFKNEYSRTLESGKLEPVDVNFNNSDISIFGVQHMAGNVREWVDSFLRPYPGSRYHSTKIGKEKVIRGGSWAQPKTHAVGWFRSSSKQNYAWKDVGFRCARPAQ